MSIRAITPTEQAYLDAESQRVELFLGFTDSPPVVFTCVVNQTFATHDMVAQFVFDGAVGDIADVLPNMSIWVGSDVGLYDIGNCRVRKSPTSDTMYIGEGSEIDWDVDLHITVVDEMLLWPKHLRIVNETVYMDYDVPFTDQHVIFDPVPIMGCNAVVDVDTYPVTVNFPEASRSSVFDSTISAWLWTATSGVMTGETTNDPTLTISAYPPDGLIRVALKLTTAAGAEFTGYRYVKVYDDEEDIYGVKLHRPVEVFKLGSCHGDYKSGNFSFEVTLFGNATVSEIRDRAPIVLFAKDYYGDDIISIGQLEGRVNVVALGWINAESIEADPTGGFVTFTVEGPAFWMEKMTSYPSGVRLATNTPSEWIHMPGLTVDRGLWHFLHWRTTATAILDVTLTGDTRLAAEMSSPSSSLWGQITEMASTSIMATGGFDPYGRLFISIDPQMTPVASRTWATIQNIQSSDWEGVVRIDRVPVSSISILYLSGIAIDASGSPLSYYSLSPGHVHKKYGSPQVLERILLTSQAQANEMAGLYAGWKNDIYPAIPISFASNNRMFTLFPPQFGHLNLVDTDTERGVYVDINLIPRSINYEWDEAAGDLTVQVDFENETFPALSTDGDIPNVVTPEEMSYPPSSGYGGNYTIPPLPAIVLPPSVQNTNYPSTIVIASSTHGVYWTENAEVAEDNPGGVVWKAMNGGLLPTDIADIWKVLVSPNGSVFLQTPYSVFAAKSIGSSFLNIATSADFNTGVIHDIALDPNESETIAIIGGKSTHPYFNPMAKLILANTDGITFDSGNVIRMQNYWRSGIAFVGGQWVAVGNYDGVFASPWVYVFDKDGSLIINQGISSSVGSDAMARNIISAGSQDLGFYWTLSAGIRRVTGEGLIFSDPPNANMVPTDKRQGVASSPTGNILIGVDGTALKKSVDGGVTWTTLIIPVGPTVFCDCKDDYRFLIGGGTNMFVTMDQGASVVTLVGNLPYLAALINIVGIRYVS
jgi:hypothetical protein